MTPTKITKHFTACLATCTLMPSESSYCFFFKFPNKMHSVFDKFIFDPANLHVIEKFIYGVNCVFHRFYFP